MLQKLFYFKDIWSDLKKNIKSLILTDEFIVKLKILNLTDMIIDRYEETENCIYHRYYPFVLSLDDAKKLIEFNSQTTKLVISPEYGEKILTIL